MTEALFSVHTVPWLLDLVWSSWTLCIRSLWNTRRSFGGKGIHWIPLDVHLSPPPSLQYQCAPLDSASIAGPTQWWMAMATARVWRCLTDPELRTHPRCQQMDPIQGQRALCPLSAPKWIPWKLYDWCHSMPCPKHWYHREFRIKSLWWFQKFSCSQTDWDPWRIIHRFYSEVSKCALRDALDFTELVSEFTGRWRKIKDITAMILKDYPWPFWKAWQKRTKQTLFSRFLPTNIPTALMTKKGGYLVIFSFFPSKCHVQRCRVHPDSRLSDPRTCRHRSLRNKDTVTNICIENIYIYIHTVLMKPRMQV